MSLTGTYDPANVFAKILAGQIPSAKVWEDDAVLVFMDAFPQTEGHVLVISKTSAARNLLEVEPEVLATLAAAVQRTARALTRALGPDGFAVMQFNGEASGQTVFHLHFHIIPRWANRALAGHATGAMADANGLNALAARIAAALD
jgi:histidine triad (HIT) family protein